MARVVHRVAHLVLRLDEMHVEAVETKQRPRPHPNAPWQLGGIRGGEDVGDVPLRAWPHPGHYQCVVHAPSFWSASASIFALIAAI